MALVTVGNTRIGSPFYVNHPRYGVDYEFATSYNFIHYKFIATERSYEKKIRIAYYSFRPSSNYYNLVLGIYQKELIPAVFRAVNGVPVEVLSEGHLTFYCKDIKDSWLYFEVYLKRDFEPGEEIWAGVWSEFFTPVGDSQNVAKGTCGMQTYYTFGTFGRKKDYAPYFDSEEIFTADDGVEAAKGNYSLYWQYYNAPIPNDCNVKVGNPRMGNKWMETRTVEYEDENEELYEEDIMLDYVSAISFMGYFYQIPKTMINNKIYLHVYNRHPVTEMYEEIEGYTDVDFVPVVYKCDSSGKFTELLTSEVFTVTKEFGYDGWIDVELNLKRIVNAGEYIFVGYYSFGVNNVWHENPNWIVGTYIDRRFYTSGYSISYISGIIRDGSILNRQSNDCTPRYYSIYFEYCDTLPRTDYVRCVSSSGNVVSVVFKSARVKKALQEIKQISDREKRKLALFKLFSDVKIFQDTAEKKISFYRLFSDTKKLQDIAEKKLALFRLFSDVKRFQDIEERKTDAKRNLLTAGNLYDKVLRSSELKRNNSESFGLRDFINRTIGLFAKVFTKLDASDDVHRRLKIKRSESSVNTLSTRLNAGRLIFRTVATVFGLWDWLKGKIRNENCIVELFTPITDVLELECKI